MDLRSLSTQDFLFNYYSFGSLLVTLIMFLLGIFFLSLKDKTTATIHFGVGCILLSFFQTGYFLAAFLYHPIGAYHRWITAGFILPAVLHLGQFLLRWPGNNYARLGNVLLAIQWILALISVSVFVYYTSLADKKYHFTAHHWDFQVDEPSKYLAGMIALFSLFNFFLIPMYRIIFKLAGRKRMIMVSYMIAFLTAAVIPNLFNVMSRDGAMERATYLTAQVLLFYFAFFLITIIFINTSNEKTTFMIKIVGISMVTVMLIFEQLAFIYDQEKEDQFNRISLATINRYLHSQNIPDSISYMVKHPKSASSLQYPKYDPNLGLDLDTIRVDLEFSRIFEEAQSLIEQGFRPRLLVLMNNTPPEFTGYRNSILAFLETNKQVEDENLKRLFLDYLMELNKKTFIVSNKLNDIPANQFCKKYQSLIQSYKELDSFLAHIESRIDQCQWDNKDVSGEELKTQVSKYFRFFKKTETRHYRKNMDNSKHFVAFMVYNPIDKTITEAGIPYLDYRKEMSRSAKKEMGLMVVALGVLLFAFPFFFKLSLVNPLDGLTSAVTKVNEGDLEVKVPIHVNDEIGFLANSFNHMVGSIREARRQLQDYAENLELKVMERTKEVQEKMDEIHKLKVQQDGDYFLTSLLAKPLFYNANKSPKIKTEFFVHQKKQFEFRKKTGDLGGDISVTGNLRLGKPENFRRYTVALNGDAMGKSMQGAGGSLVMGVVMNSIMARSAGNNRVLDETPEEWLSSVYEEFNSVFKSFNGTMVISATVFVVDDESGEAWYFNAEHPFSVLYRNGKASFIETELQLRKLGLDSEIPFQIRRFQFLPGDILVLGTDGRDDIDLTPQEDFRTINEDEELFLSYVEAAKGDIHQIEAILLTKGELTDDISLLRLDFQPNQGESSMPDAPEKDGIQILEESHSLIDGTAGDLFQASDEERWEDQFTTVNAYEEGRKLLKSGDVDSAIELMYKAYSNDQSDPKLNKLLSLLTFKGRDYDRAVQVLEKYLDQDPNASEFWYYLAIAQKKVGEISKAIHASLKSYELKADFMPNLLSLADLYRLQEDLDKSRKIAEQARKIEPDNKNLKRLYQLLEKKS